MNIVLRIHKYVFVYLLNRNQCCYMQKSRKFANIEVCLRKDNKINLLFYCIDLLNYGIKSAFSEEAKISYIAGMFYYSLYVT